MNPIPEWYASDNGFASLAAMDTAHRPIVELATAALLGTGGSVLDLGCGNGALLKKSAKQTPVSSPSASTSSPPGSSTPRG